MDKYDICNLGLARLGCTFITDFDDDSDEADQCEAHYEPVRDALLRRFPWRFACKWATLVKDVRDDYGIAEAATATTIQDTDKVWVADAYIGYYVYLSGGTGAGQVRAITDNDNDTLTVATWNTNPDATSRYEIWENRPPHPWDYQYDLPADFLRFVETSPEGDLFEVADGATLLRTDEDSMVIQYVSKDETVGDYDPLFVEALAVALATAMCIPLVQDKVMFGDLREEAEAAYARAVLADRRDSKRRPTGKTWLEARI